jgi:hypothetical protein
MGNVLNIVGLGQPAIDNSNEVCLPLPASEQSVVAVEKIVTVEERLHAADSIVGEAHGIGAGPFSRDVWQLIFEHVDLPTMIALAMVCKHTRSAAMCSRAWPLLIDKKFVSTILCVINNTLILCICFTGHWSQCDIGAIANVSTSNCEQVKGQFR